ncbi:MAG: alkaline phosphatase D family protein [Actinomycetota bacterium]
MVSSPFPALSRRAFLALGATVVVTACSTSKSSSPVPDAALPVDPFTLGVASGDPTPTSVVIWTRLAPEPLAGGGMPPADVDVLWEVSDSADFSTVIASGLARAEARYAHSVHVDVSLADRDAEVDPWVFYRFRIAQWTSPVGRTRCAAPEGSTEPVMLATASCQNWTDGYYNAYADMVEQSPDLVVFLGDYIYEGGQGSLTNGDTRLHNGQEVVTAEEYRNRYALYRSDPLLRAAHALCPWLVIWDDHEVDNNYADLVSQDTAADAPSWADFTRRRADAYQVWWEHMPVRMNPPVDENLTIYRRLSWGSLIDMVALDGRQYRDDQACNDAVLQTTPACEEASDEIRSMLGTEQETWVVDTLAAGSSIWSVIANQTVMTDIRLGDAILNHDQWDGYAPSRDRILSGLRDAEIADLVVLTGDIHLAGVGTLNTTGTVQDVLGVEFVTTSISSSGNIPDGYEDLFIALPTIVDADTRHRGYTLHTVTSEDWTATYRIVADNARENSPSTTWKTFRVRRGSSDVAAV